MFVFMIVLIVVFCISAVLTAMFNDAAYATCKLSVKDEAIKSICVFFMVLSMALLCSVQW